MTQWAHFSFAQLLLATSRRRSLMNRMGEMDKKLNNIARALSDLGYLTATKSFLAWLTKAHGVQTATSLPGDYEQSHVFLLQRDDGSALILKVHQQLSAAKRELMAYRMLSGLSFQFVPKLVGVWPQDARFLLLEKMPGEPAIGLSPTLYQSAGRVLGQLHRVPHSDLDSMSLSEAYVRRGMTLLQYPLEFAERSLLKTCVEVLDGQTLGSRVICHRDYRSRNWLVEPRTERFSVIDFGQCRADYFLCDLVHVYVETMSSGSTSSWNAFLHGYGRTLEDDERSILSALIGLYGLTTLVRVRRGQGQGNALEGRRYCAVSRRLMGHRSSC